MPYNIPNRLLGIPWLDAGGSRITSGNIYWVDSTTGTSDAAGTKPSEPLSTIAAAVAKCTASKYDTIYVMPGHTETLTAAGSITLSTAGVRIVGLGEGNLRPTISYSSLATASLLVTAANCTVENMIFDMTGIDGLDNPIHVQAAAFTLRDCEIEMADGSGQADLAVLTTASANDMLIEGCYFFGSTDAGTATAIRIVGGDSIKIKNNVIIGSFTTTLGGIQNVTTTATNILIEGNKIINRTAVSTVAITLHASCTGAIVNNRLGILNGTAPIVAAAIDMVGGNYYAAAAGVTAGTLI